MSAGAVDLGAVRRSRLLDELAALSAVGVDVRGLLAREVEGMAKQRMTAPVTVRLREDTLDEAERLADALADTSEARAAGGQWSRATVLRWAIEVGLEELARRAARGGAR